MKSRFFTIVTTLLTLSLVFLGITSALCSTTPEYNSTELTNRLKTGAYLQKVDNLMIIVDGQTTTNRKTRWGKNKDQTKTFLEHLSATIPNIPHRRMLRVFGPDAKSYEKDFSTTFGFFHTDNQRFTPIIATKTLDVSDFDPLGLTFISGTKDLRKLSGSHAIIIISDGKHIPKSAIYESAYMKKKFGGSVCYYPILKGNDPKGAKNMSTLAKIGGCGFLAQYEAIDSPEKLTDYVEKVLFAKRRLPVQPEPVVEPEPEVQPEEPVVEEPIIDTVTEIAEEPVIPDVIEDQFVEEIPVDDDKVIILERQLPHDKVVTIELHVEFDLNKATLRPGNEEEINKVAEFMILYPETEALLEGHTCNLGSDTYNLKLSSRRAETVKNYLVKNFGINPERLKTRGAGESEPIADNSNEEGRMKNRRVMAVISTIVTDYVVIEQEILKSDFLNDDFLLPPVDQVVDEMMEEPIIDQDQESTDSTEMTPEPVEATDTPTITIAPEQTDTTDVDESGVDDQAIETSPSDDVQAEEPAQDGMDETPEVEITPAASSDSPALTSSPDEDETPLVQGTQGDESAQEPVPTIEYLPESAIKPSLETDNEEAEVDAAFDVQNEEKELTPETAPLEPTETPATEQQVEDENDLPGVDTGTEEVVDEESKVLEKDVPPEEVVAPLTEQSKKEAAPQQVDTTEDVVVVAPGESAFDDGKNEHEVVASEEMSSEPVLSPEEQDVFESIVTQDKEPENNPAPQKEKISTEEESFL